MTSLLFTSHCPYIHCVTYFHSPLLQVLCTCTGCHRQRLKLTQITTSHHQKTPRAPGSYISFTAWSNRYDSLVGYLDLLLYHRKSPQTALLRCKKIQLAYWNVLVLKARDPSSLRIHFCCCWCCWGTKITFSAENGMESSWLAGQGGLTPGESPAHSRGPSLLQMVPLTPGRTRREVSVLIPQRDHLKGFFFPPDCSKKLSPLRPGSVTFHMMNSTTLGLSSCSVLPILIGVESWHISSC